MQRIPGNCRACRRRPLPRLDPRPITIAILGTLTLLMVAVLNGLALV